MVSTESKEVSKSQIYNVYQNKNNKKKSVVVKRSYIEDYLLRYWKAIILIYLSIIKPKSNKGDMQQELKLYTIFKFPIDSRNRLLNTCNKKGLWCGKWDSLNILDMYIDLKYSLSLWQTCLF